MITIPLNLIWFIIIIDVIIVGLCVFAAWASYSHERKAIAARELEVKVCSGILDEVTQIQHETDIVLWHRQMAITEQEERLGSVVERERAVREAELDLGRHVHDTYTLANAAMHQVSEDTQVMDLDWEEVQGGPS